MFHGSLEVTGWLINNKIAYLTDCNSIPDSSAELVNNVEHLVIDGLRVREHSTHFSFDQALEFANKISAKHIEFFAG